MTVNPPFGRQSRSGRRGAPRDDGHCFLIGHRNDHGMGADDRAMTVIRRPDDDDGHRTVIEGGTAPGKGAAFIGNSPSSRISGNHQFCTLATGRGISGVWCTLPAAGAKTARIQIRAFLGLADFVLGPRRGPLAQNHVDFPPRRGTRGIWKVRNGCFLEMINYWNY